LQRRLRDSATQAAFGFGEKVRIREVENPNQIAIGGIRVRWNTQYP